MVDMSLHSDIFLWSRGNHYLLLLLNAAWLAEKQTDSLLEYSVWYNMEDIYFSLFNEFILKSVAY
jgi:hypothetical protein